MKEDFLHYIWKFKKFDLVNARTTNGELVTLIDPGTHNQYSGPDFFNAKLKLGSQLWAGNVEIHINASDWYAHNHQQDPAYDSVILHVVWEEDVAIYRKDDSNIPTLELQSIVKQETLQGYRNLLTQEQRWINCETSFKDFDDFLLKNWLERLYYERLEEKAETILALLKKDENNWEAVLFQLLAKNFGLNINGGAFLSLAQNTGFSVVQKCRPSAFRLEALFLGQAGLLEGDLEEVYYNDLKQEYNYLAKKYRLNNSVIEKPKYFRLRPDNFPTIRLSQLAVLYASRPHLFSSILKSGSKKEMEEIFETGVTPYWKNHYNFGKPHSSRNKKLTSGFIDLLIINTIVPLRFCYLKKTGTGNDPEFLSLINEIKTEKNSIVERFNALRINTALTAMDSQALLHLKHSYCEKNACLKCSLGAKLLEQDQ